MVETRRAILEALAVEISESGLAGLSIQAVADRAGVTHRTVYNYFPTREALNDAFAEHVEAVISEGRDVRLEDGAGVDDLPRVAGQGQELFGAHAAHIEAYVMMTMATGAAARVFRDRSTKIEKLLDDELGPLDPGVARLVTSAIRMFLSSSGWYLLNKHHGLSTSDARRMSEWAVKALLDAVRRGEVPKRVEKRKTKRA